jgi:hypothetical protein
MGALTGTATLGHLLNLWQSDASNLRFRQIDDSKFMLETNFYDFKN